MSDQFRDLCQKLTIEERFLILANYFETTKKIIAENAPSGLSENQLKRYVYEKMYDEPAPAEIWVD